MDVSDIIFFLNSTALTPDSKPLDKLMSDKLLAVHDETIYAQTLTQSINAYSTDWAFRNSKNLGDTLCKAFNIDSSALRTCTTLQVLSASSTAMAAVAASDPAMTVIAASSSTLQVLVNSDIAMTAIAASNTAMAAIVALDTAMEIIASSDTAMARIAASSIASTICIGVIQGKRSILLATLLNSSKFTKSEQKLISRSNPTILLANTSTILFPVSHVSDDAAYHTCYIKDLFESKSRYTRGIDSTSTILVNGGVFLRGVSASNTNYTTTITFECYTVK